MTDKCHFCGGWNACCSTKITTVNATGGNFDIRTLEPRDPTPIFCDHERWREAEKALVSVGCI